MAVTTAALSGTITDVVGDLDPKYLGRVVVAIEANTDGSLLLDTTGDRLMAGAKRVTVDKTSGAYSITLVKTDSADVLPATGRLYRVHLIYPSGIPGAGNVYRSSGWWELEADGSLSDADKWPGLEVTAVSTELLASLADMVDDVETRHAAVMGVVATTEGLMTSVLGSGGTFDTELSATFARVESVPLNVLDFGAVGDGTTDDTAAIQAALDVSTVGSPRTIYFPRGNYKITSELLWPAGAYGTAVHGEARENTRIVQATDGAAVFAFRTTVHSVEVTDLTLTYTNQQTAGLAAFYYDGTATDNNFFHHLYQRVTVEKAYQGWAVSTNMTSQSLWNCSWEDIKLLRTKHRCFYINRGTGAPSNKMKGIGIYQTDDATLRNTGIAFDINGAVISMENVSVEGWTDRVFYVQGGAMVDVFNLSIEQHHFEAAIVYVCQVEASSILNIRLFGVEGSNIASNNSVCVFFKSNGRTSYLRHGRHNVTLGTTPTIAEVVYTTDPVNVVLEDIRKDGGGWSQSGLGARTQTTSRTQQGPSLQAVRWETANYTVKVTDNIVVGNGSSITISLPDPTTVQAGARYTVKNIHSTSLTVASLGTSKTIDGASTQALAQWARIRVISDGTNWISI